MEINEWLFEYGGSKNGMFHRNLFSSRQDEEDTLAQYVKDQNNKDAYKTLFYYESDDIYNCRIMGSLMFDFDKEIHAEQEYKQIVRDVVMAFLFIEEEMHIKESDIRLYFSGSKGFHLEVPFELLGIEPSADLAEQYKIIGKKITNEIIHNTVDTKIYERRRLFRIPNTINTKTGLYKVPITLDMLRKFSYEEMKEYASSPKEIAHNNSFIPNKETTKAYKRILMIYKLKELKSRHPKTIVSVEKKDLLPCVKKILHTGTEQGGRNNTCVAVASSIAQSGTEIQEAKELMLSWNSLNEPPLSEYEVLRTVESAYAMAHNGRGYGCSFFKDNDYCIGEECKLY